MKKAFFLLLFAGAFNLAEADDQIIKKINENCWLVLKKNNQIDTSIRAGGKYIYFYGGYEILDTINYVDTSIQQSVREKIYREGKILLSQECSVPKLMPENFFLKHSLESKRYYGVMENNQIIKRVETGKEIGFAWELIGLIIILGTSIIQLSLKNGYKLAPLTTTGALCLLFAAIMTMMNIPEINFLSGAIIFLMPAITALAILPWELKTPSDSSDKSHQKIFDRLIAIANLIGAVTIFMVALLPINTSIIITLSIITISVVIKAKSIRRIFQNNIFKGSNLAGSD